MVDDGQWRRCSACKKPIPFGANYWACSVSTCNRKRTALSFCSVSCWEVHLPGANHREAWAVERRAPSGPEEEGDARATTTSRSGGKRRLVRSEPTRPLASDGGNAEILIVASRLKDYVRARSGFNTSDRVLGPLSDIVRRVCDEAVASARRDGRSTVLDRDIPGG